MTPYQQLRADQHEDITLASDHALTAYLAECPISDALLDLIPTTAIEQLHLTRARRTAA